MNWFQMGAPTTEPAALVIALLSLLPTQTPATRSFVYPMVHASRYSWVVPVFTATSYPGTESEKARPNIGALASSSERMLVMSLATAGSIIWAVPFLFPQRFLP